MLARDVVIAGSVAVLLGVAYCRPAPDVDLAIAQRDAVTVALEYRHQRLRTDSAERITMRAEAGQRRAESRLRQATGALEGTLTAGERLAADSTAGADTLRAMLAASVAETRVYLAHVGVYQDSVRALFVAWSSERASYRASLAAADSVIAAERAVGVLLTKGAQCRILWVRCPTRTQSFVGGALVTLTLLVL